MRIRKVLIVFGLTTAFFACKNENKQHVTIDPSSNQNAKKTTIDSTEVEVTKAIVKPANQDKNHLETLNEESLNKIHIPLKRNDSSLYLIAEMKSDHRIFGYARPDKNSQKLILFSIFTDEVEGNPFKCRYGSYYDISKNNQNFSLKYNGQKDDFIATIIADSLNNKRDVYFEKKWIEID